jgi:hypothetical protein
MVGEAIQQLHPDNDSYSARRPMIGRIDDPRAEDLMVWKFALPPLPTQSTLTTFPGAGFVAMVGEAIQQLHPDNDSYSVRNTTFTTYLTLTM